MFLYIVLTLQGYIWYEPIIILGLWFSNTPPWANTAINSCLIKTPKNPVEKYGERIHSVARCIALVASLKTIMRNFWKNSFIEKKSTIIVFRTFYNLQDYNFQDLLDPVIRAIQGRSPPKLCRSLSRLIPILWIHFLNVVAGKDLVNKSATLLHDWTFKIFTSPCFWSSWV